MANPRDLDRITAYIESGNEWRSNGALADPRVNGLNLLTLQLSGVDLSGADLSGVNLRGTNFSGADLSGTNLNDVSLSGADLRGAILHGASLRRAILSGADLTRATGMKADLREADLTGATLNGANLIGANLGAAALSLAQLQGADFHDANLSGTDLGSTNLMESNLSGTNLNAADLSGAFLMKANLREADLSGTNLCGADLQGADLSRAELRWTILGGTNMAHAKGLETCLHGGPSVIDFRTLTTSGNLPLSFLRGCGLPDHFIAYVSSFLGQPIRFDSCFISYSTEDQDFADRLHADLQDKGVRCWFSPKDMQAGKKIHEQIDEAIQIHDRLLLVLSEHSMNSEWVKTEISKARKREVLENRRMLFPLSLIGFDRLRDWECFDADRGSDSANEIRQYLIPDFSRWKDHDSYQRGLERVVKGLKLESPDQSA